MSHSSHYVVNPFPTVVGHGISGREYRFVAYPWGSDFLPTEALYTFARKDAISSWFVLYVGETSDASVRISRDLHLHHKAADALARGATHILFLPFAGSDLERRRAEQDLIDALNPPCNGRSGFIR